MNKRDSIQIHKSVIIYSSLINSTHIFESLSNICNIILNQFKIKYINTEFILKSQVMTKKNMYFTSL